MYHGPLAATGGGLALSLIWWPLAIFAVVVLGVALYRMTASLNV